VHETPEISENSEAGVTLVELLIYVVLLGVVFILVTTMLINSLNTQQTVYGVIGSSTQAQSAADSIETGIRSSSAFQLTAPSGTSQFLTARVPTGASASSITWSCAAWYWSSTSKQIRYKVSSTAIASVNDSTSASWSTLANGVIAGSGSTIFGGDTTQLTINFQATSGKGYPVGIKSSAVRRSDVWVSAPCF
jgi:hypothetical protein